MNPKSVSLVSIALPVVTIFASRSGVAAQEPKCFPPLVAARGREVKHDPT
jgi:hypothetical protein